MDAVLGYHVNPLTCGVAKFNLLVARRLGVPVLQLFDPGAAECGAPLLSLKIAEFRDEDLPALERLLDGSKWRHSFRLFLHAWSGTAIEQRLLCQAEMVYCGNSELAATLRGDRPDLKELWCPSTLLDTVRFEPAEISVFSFGMAHKVRTEYYERLRDLLDRTGRTYCVYLSTALHEATSFDGSFTVVFDELRRLFGVRIYFLGYLSDAAVYNYLIGSTFFAAFFEKGVRANNTSVNAAMQSGSVVITNLDAQSPAELAHGVTVLDIRQCKALPTDPEVLEAIRERARVAATTGLGWDRLVCALRRD